MSFERERAATHPDLAEMEAGEWTELTPIEKMEEWIQHLFTTRSRSGRSASSV